MEFSSNRDCAFGCGTNQCNPSPCERDGCGTPPAAQCGDAILLQVPLAGTCQASGTCTQPVQETHCTRCCIPGAAAHCATTFAECVAAGVRREFHVAVNGNDANDGVTAPFRTFARAALAANRPNDLVTLAAGTYQARQVALDSSGEQGAPITFRAAPGATVVLSGGSNNQGLYAVGSWLTFQDLVFEQFTIAMVMGPNPDVPLTSTPSHLRVERCVFRSNNVALLLDAEGSSENQLSVGSDFVVSHSTFYRDGTPGLSGKAAVHVYAGNDVVFEDNVFQENASGVQLFAPVLSTALGDRVAGDRVLFQRNRFQENTAAAIGIGSRGTPTTSTMLTWDHVRVQNNVFWQGGLGVDVGNQNDSLVVGAVLVVHNTFVANAIGLGVTAASQLEVLNNIFAGGTFFVTQTAPLAQHHMDHNLFDDGLAVRFKLGTAPETGLAGWQAATGLDMASLAADPGFAAPDGGDFHLGAGSAAVDQGVVLVPAVTDDLDGDTRPSMQGPDLGADER